jgi:hypothetical protein
MVFITTFGDLYRRLWNIKSVFKNNHFALTILSYPLIGTE